MTEIKIDFLLVLATRATGDETMYKVGTVCIKNAGRDQGLYCVVLEEKEDKVLVDGQTRRRQVNVAHLTPTDKTAKVKANASADEVVKAFSELKIEVKVTKPKKAAEKPLKKRTIAASTKKAPAKKAEAKPAAKKAPAKEAEKPAEKKAE